MRVKSTDDMREITLETAEELSKFINLVEDHVTNNDVDMLESWVDSEFHRIYVTYAYPDVTKVN
jgi:hypothetical protein